MSIYFFDLRDGNELVIDEEGMELRDTQAAQDEAARSLAGFAWDALRQVETASDINRSEEVSSQLPLSLERLQLHARFSRRKVLVIEDEPLIRFNTADVIEDLEFAAIEAENADAAVVILESRRIDADIRMSGSMDGVQLAFLIRERWPPIKILAASGNASLAPDGLPAGGRFLRKPYTPMLCAS